MYICICAAHACVCVHGYKHVYAEVKEMMVVTLMLGFKSVFLKEERE